MEANLSAIIAQASMPELIEIILKLDEQSNIELLYLEVADRINS